jgi:hypothetical protein
MRGEFPRGLSIVQRLGNRAAVASLVARENGYPVALHDTDSWAMPLHHAINPIICDYVTADIIFRGRDW